MWRGEVRVYCSGFYKASKAGFAMARETSISVIGKTLYNISPAIYAENKYFPAIIVEPGLTYDLPRCFCELVWDISYNCTNAVILRTIMRKLRRQILAWTMQLKKVHLSPQWRNNVSKMTDKEAGDRIDSIWWSKPPAYKSLSLI